MNSFSLVAKLSNQQLETADYNILQAGIEKVISPRFPNARSIAMRLQGDTLYVASSDKIRSLSRPKSILMFNEPPQFEKFFLSFDDEIIAHYTKMDKQECGLPDSVATTQSHIFGCLFQLSSCNSKNLIGFKKLILMVSNEIKCDENQNVWLNTLILSLSVAGDQLKKPDDITITSVNGALHKILITTQNVFFEPHLDCNFDGRVALLSYLSKKICDQHRPMSAVETLFLGTKKNAFLAFIALDTLGGAFEISGYGTKPKLIWHPPVEGLSGNGQKLAENLILEWGGSLEVKDKWPFAEPAPGRVPNIYKPIWESVPLNNSQETEIKTSFQKTIEIIKGYQACQGNTIIAWLYDILISNQAIFNQCHIGHYRLRKLDNELWDFSFDFMGFYQDFAERFLVPQSPVLIALPALDKEALNRIPTKVSEAHKRYENRKIDLVNSLDYGARTMLVQLLQDINLPANSVDLPYQFGWPWQWYQLLYTHPFDVQLRLKVPLQDSAVLGHATIGIMTLGAKVSPVLYKPTTAIRM